VNDHNIPVYLSPTNIALLRGALDQHARTNRGTDVERDAHALADRLRKALDEYHDEAAAMHGRKRRHTGRGSTYTT
jgi:hypothetical protein